MYLRILYMRSHLCSHHYECLRLISPLRKKNNYVIGQAFPVGSADYIFKCAGYLVSRVKYIF